MITFLVYIFFMGLAYTPYYLLIFGMILLLHMIGVSRRQAIFVSFLLFGVFLGSMETQIKNHSDISPPSMILGDYIHSYTEDHWTYPSTPYERLQIPWFLQTPQVYFLSTTILWGFLGLVLQGGYIYLKNPPDTETRSTLIVASCIAVYLTTATILVYEMS